MLSNRSTGRTHLLTFWESKDVAERHRGFHREAFGFGTAAVWSEGPQAPPECVDAWRADRTAPVHCEEYPEAFDAVRNESNGDR